MQILHEMQPHLEVKELTRWYWTYWRQNGRSRGWIQWQQASIKFKIVSAFIKCFKKKGRTQFFAGVLGVGSITAGAGIVQSCKILFIFSQGNEYLLGKPNAINSWWELASTTPSPDFHPSPPSWHTLSASETYTLIRKESGVLCPGLQPCLHLWAPIFGIPKASQLFSLLWLWLASLGEGLAIKFTINHDFKALHYFPEQRCYRWGSVRSEQ